MAGPKVFVTRDIDAEAIQKLAGETELELWPGDFPPSTVELLEQARDAHGILTTVMDRIDRALLEAAPHLKVVSQMAVGVDNIDVEEATRRGIPVGHTPRVLSSATADLAFSLLMAAARRVVEAERFVRAGHWKLAFHPKHWLGADVGGATIGIVGLGSIGLEMAKRARGFDMKVLYHSRTRPEFLKEAKEGRNNMEYVDLSTLLRDSDFVTLHVPLTPDTRHLIGEKEMAAMKPTGILINTSRGPVVDPTALYRALKEGWIAGAALDVTESEPIPSDDPLLGLENLIVTPHIGSASVGSRKGMAMLATRNLLAGVRGEPLIHCVNPEVYGSP